MSKIRRVIAALVCVNLLACSTVRPRIEPLDSVPPHELPRTVRLALIDGRVVTLRGATRVDDSISGTVADSGRTSIPVKDVASWSQVRCSPLKTAGLVLGASAGILIAFIYLTATDKPLDVLNAGTTP